MANEAETAAGADGGVKIFFKIDNKIVLRGYSKNANIANSKKHTRGVLGHTWALIQHAQMNLDSVKSLISHEVNIDRNTKMNLSEDDYIKNTKQLIRIVIPDVDSYEIASYYDKTINDDTITSGHKSLVCLPLLIENTVIGAMWLHFTKPQHFTAEELDEFQLYANQAAIALHNDTEIKLLEINEKIGKFRTNAQDTAQIIVDYTKERFDTEGVIFYVAEPSRKRLKLFASTKDDDESPHMPVGKTVKYNKGLAGHHFVGKNKDEISYSNKTLHVASYHDLPLSHKIQADEALGKLKSLYSIRLEAPLTGKKIGVLILNDDTDRTYNASDEDLRRFSELAANLLALVKFKRLHLVVRIMSLILIVAGIMILVAASLATQLIYQDSQVDIQSRIFAFIIAVVAGSIMLFLGGITSLDSWWSES